MGNEKPFHYYLHGTSFENAENIMHNSLIGTEPDNWRLNWVMCDPDKLYLHKIPTWEEVSQDFGYAISPDTYKSFYDGYFMQAIESGQIAAAVQGSTNTKICVLVFKISDEIAEQFIEKDSSIAREQSTTYQADKKTLHEKCLLNEITCHVQYYRDNYNQYLRPHYLTRINREYRDELNIYDDPILVEAIDWAREQDAPFIEADSDTMDFCFKYGDIPFQT